MALDDEAAKIAWLTLLGERTFSVFVRRRAAGERIDADTARAIAAEDLRAERPELWEAYIEIEHPEPDRSGPFLDSFEDERVRRPARRRSPRRASRWPAGWRIP